MAKKVEFIKCLTPAFRVSFPFLTEARTGLDGNSKPKYSVKMLFPKQMEAADAAKMKAIYDACAKVATEFWGPKLPATLKKPFRDGDTESDMPEDTGFKIATARTMYKPGVVDKRNVEVTDDDSIKNVLYAGCWARATILVGATDTAGSKCVYFILQNIQKLRDDDKFGNRVDASTDFEPVEFGDAESDFADATESSFA